MNPPSTANVCTRCRPPPASVALIVCSQLLVPESGGAAGRTLRLSYQLRDASGRTAVLADGVTLRALLSRTGGAAVPAAANGTAAQLPVCNAADADAASGIGECAVTVDDGLFPAAGVAEAAVAVQLRIG